LSPPLLSSTDSIEPVEIGADDNDELVLGSDSDEGSFGLD
jgi:hypothetical protein